MTWNGSQLDTARSCFDAFADENLITITRVTSRGSFNTATGKRTPTTVSATMRAIVGRFRVEPGPSTDAPIWRAVFSVLAEECLDDTAAAFRPQATDHITFRGRTWTFDRAPESKMGDQVYDIHATASGTMTTQ